MRCDMCRRRKSVAAAPPTRRPGRKARARANRRPPCLTHDVHPSARDPKPHCARPPSPTQSCVPLAVSSPVHAVVCSFNVARHCAPPAHTPRPRPAATWPCLALRSRPPRPRRATTSLVLCAPAGLQGGRAWCARALRSRVAVYGKQLGGGRCQQQCVDASNHLEPWLASFAGVRPLRVRPSLRALNGGAGAGARRRVMRRVSV